ncbi:site-specific DNA-methyltransferase [Novosphingobium beihaiensis]|uniref:site-specific DNA-methyltransferase (adenine-specific) n=1 Tax=Novosphingobium beihaiensis TaxID=2930389 RepID=A0ABT0BNQ6_9SPHN|nr:site-specific DNA-methyltransferase [Novosphingobium beihaiensis]MCJ2186466.1 site-specific DNA-methyltransferase [Novosphingobium beihaiensis]
MPTLQWWTRDDDVKAADAVPYRLLEEVPELGAGDPDAGNMLIQGDNLEALKALLPYYAGQVKCVYIDPPYNTKSAFEHYDDNLEHSQWLAMIYPRLVLLRELLAEEGSIWVSIDDNEGHYLKVIMDEVFGRSNFLSSMIWRKNYSPKSTARHFSEDHDYLLVYAKNSEKWRPNLMPRTEKQNTAYKNPDGDPRGPWKTSDLSARNFYSKGIYSITSPSGRFIERPPGGNYWRVAENKFWELDRDNRIWWGRDGSAIPQIKRFLSEVKQGIVPQTYWSYEEVGHTQDAKKEVLALSRSDVFITPKPEALLRRTLHIASNPGDLVLDSFLGSGTTAAVAHKMGRRYIGIEMGDHAATHCQPRLSKVVEGEQGGISEAVAWKGGGGFRFFRLGPSVFDDQGQIRPNIEFDTLAAHVWFSEKEKPWEQPSRKGTVLGIKDGKALALLYNGILKDRSVDGGNVLTRATLKVIRQDLPEGFDGPLMIYGERCILSDATLEREKITFKQTPYDVKARA